MTPYEMAVSRAKTHNSPLVSRIRRGLIGDGQTFRGNKIEILSYVRQEKESF